MNCGFSLQALMFEELIPTPVSAVQNSCPLHNSASLNMDLPHGSPARS
jgi:hypothetical protein